MNAFRIKRKPIADQVIVITGASSGIGLATAKYAAKLGAKVVLSSRNMDDLVHAVEEIKFAGGDAFAVSADVSIYEALENLREQAIQHFGRIDTWVNNAGGSIYGKLMDLELEEEKKLFDTNFWSVRNGSRIALAELCKSVGVLINVGSEVSARSIPLQGIYAATKHAVKAYTDALRMELEEDDVPVAVCLVRPTAIATPFPEHALNRLTEGYPSLPSPMFHPDAVAAAIVDCAEHPRRDVYVGGSSKLFSILEALAPRMVDRVMETKLFGEQTKGSSLEHTEKNEGILHAPEAEGKILGLRHPGMKKESLFSALMRRGRKPGASSELWSSADD